MKKYLLISLLFAFVVILSCKKENCSAGKGGGVNLMIFPQHHGQAIPGAKAYIKFNSQSSPASLSAFDLTVQGDSDEVQISATNIRCGDYYIYCVGYDTSFAQTVKGGIPYSIPDYANGEIDMEVPVTE